MRHDEPGSTLDDPGGTSDNNLPPVGDIARARHGRHRGRRALRRDAATANLPIIMITAREADADIQRGLAAGADDYIIKPFSPREPTQCVLKVVRRRSRPDG